MAQQITYQQIDTGDPGIGQTITKIAEMVDRYSINWGIITLAREITRPVHEKNKRGEADSLFWYVKQNIKFVNDPSNAELIQSPLVTLETAAGDCDDFVILLATLNQAIGNDVAYLTISLPGERNYSHILLVVFDRVLQEAQIYDPSGLDTYPGWMPPEVGRVRIWFRNGEYEDYDSLSGFFSKVKKFFKRLERKIRKEIKRSPIYKELKRIERRVRRERNRTLTKIQREMARFEAKVGPFAKYLIMGGKVAVSVITGGAAYAAFAAIAPSLGVIGTALTPTLTIAGQVSTASVLGAGTIHFAAGQAYAKVEELITGVENLWALNEEEWKMLAQLAATIGSAVLTVVSGGAAGPMLAASILSIISTAISTIDLIEQLDARKELLKKLKEQKAKVAMEVRVKREASAKLQSDILLLEEYLVRQQEREARLTMLQVNYDEEVNRINVEAERAVLQLKTELVEELTTYRKQLLEEIYERLLQQASDALTEIADAKTDFMYEEQDIIGYPLTTGEQLQNELNAVTGVFTVIIRELAL